MEAGNRDAMRNAYFGFNMLYDLFPEETDKFFEQHPDCAETIAQLLQGA